MNLIKICVLMAHGPRFISLRFVACINNVYEYRYWKPPSLLVCMYVFMS